MKTIERINEFLTTNSISMNAFDAAIGAGNGYIGKQIKKGASIGSDVVEKILSAYPEIDAEWLLRGRKKSVSYKSGKKNSLVVQEPESVYSTSIIEDNLVKMPVMDLQFAAGASSYTPDYLETVDHVFIPRTWLKNGQTFACGRIRGDSMAPTLLDSGYGIFRLLDKGDWGNMPNEEIFAIVSKTDHLANAQVKRVKNRLDSGFVVMTSDNPDKASNPNFNIYIDETVSIWHMDWYFTSRMPNIHNQYYSRLQALEDKFDDLLQDIKPIVKKIN